MAEHACYWWDKPKANKPKVKAFVYGKCVLWLKHKIKNINGTHRCIRCGKTALECQKH